MIVLIFGKGGGIKRIKRVQLISAFSTASEFWLIS